MEIIINLRYHHPKSTQCWVCSPLVPPKVEIQSQETTFFNTEILILQFNFPCSFTFHKNRQNVFK